MTSVLLIRHGQSEWNAQGRWQGQADPPLTELGFEQAKSIAQKIGMVDAIFSSDLQRAYHTAECIAEEIGIGPVIVEPRLKERHAGQWSGLTTKQIEDQWPGALTQRQYPPDYEHDEVLLPRVCSAFRDIATKFPNETIAIVTHGGVIYSLERALGKPFVRIENANALACTISLVETTNRFNHEIRNQNVGLHIPEDLQIQLGERTFFSHTSLSNPENNEQSSLYA